MATVPARSDSVDIEGLKITYQRRGSGPPLVLLHGYVGDGPGTFRPQLDALCDEFTVIAWDAPGAGGSSDPPESFGLTGYADCLAKFITVLGVERPHVLGLSFGGALALALYGRHPMLPRTLTLVSAYAGWAGSLPPEDVERRSQQAVKLSQLSSDELVDALMPSMFATPPAAPDINAFRAAMETFHPSGFRALARASAEDLRDVLSTIEVPTLLVYGDRDQRAPMFVAEALHSAIAASRLRVLQGVGHICNLERPEQFNQVVREFLRYAPT